MKGFAGALLALAVSAPVLTSCFDDTEIWEAMGELTDRVEKLEADLEAQANAIAALLSDGSTVAKCDKQKDGSYLVTLSDGTKFKVMPEATNYSALMTYVVEGGNKYWAVYGPAGEAEVLKDASGQKIPVSTTVDVVVKDRIYYIVINGVEYPTGYNVDDMVQVYESCKAYKDASGNVYALTFSFGEGVEVTVSVDGYKGVLFKIENASNATLVTDYYVPYGTTQTFLIDKDGVIDYVAVAPNGWKVVEREDSQSGNTYLDITAPSKAHVESGDAFADGELKAMAVVEGGDATITKLTLSAEPFKTLNVSSTRLSAEPYTGVVKYLYGVVAEDVYNKNTVVSEIEKMLAGGDAPAGYAVAESAVNLTMSEIMGSDLNPEKRYILFIIPALYDMNADMPYYVDSSMLVTREFGAILTSMSQPVPSLFDAEFSVEVIGTDKMWAGTALKSDDLFENILYAISNGIMEPYTTGLTYNGLVSQYPVEGANADVVFAPGMTYVTWCVPFDPEKTTYTQDDIVYKEFTTSPLVSGGSLVLNASTPVVTSSSISVDLSSEGAEMIYYAFLTDDEGRQLGATSEGTNDKYKFESLQKSANCTAVKGSKVVATLDNIIPESTMWLYAAAVDSEGKYGTVKCISSTLNKVKFNTLSVSYDSWEVGSDKIEYKVSVTGGTPTGYLYWIGTTKDPLWVKAGNTRQALEKYMATYPEDDAIAKVMRANGDVAADGTITITGLRMEETYVMMVLAQDETGTYSKGAYKLLTTLAADLGTVRTEGSELWNTAKSQINIEWLQDQFQPAASQAMMARYAFNFSCPQDYTAYILCASDTYFEDAGFTKKSQIMIEMENYCSRRYDDGRTPLENGQYVCEPDYYKDGEHREGQMMNVVDFYVHGLPTMGFATYFAPGSHGEGNCIYWDGGHDVNYQRALDLIEEYKTISKYEERAKAFGLKGQEAADWAAALLEAYLPYYENAEPLIYFNEGGPLYMMNPYAMGVDDKGEIHDCVVVMLKDREGNYFEPMYFPVPNYFE